MTKGEETRQFIIERSAAIFNKKGIAATAMSDIMEATKLSKGSLYVHFDNKDVLTASVVDYNMEQLSAKVQTALSKCNTAKDKLFAFIDVLGDPMNPPVDGGCPMINFGMEADDTNEVIRNKASRGVERSQQIIADVIKEGITRGEFKPDWNYKEFATIMFAMLEGGIMMSRIVGNNSKMRIITANLKKMITGQLS